MNYIISLSGKKSSGKNTVAKFIRSYFAKNVYKTDVDRCTSEFSFADELKEFCINVLGLRKEQCYGNEEDKNTLTNYSWEIAPSFLRWKFDERNTKLILDLTLKSKMTSDDLKHYYYRQVSLESGFHKTGLMTAREIMKIFGTDLIRDTFGNIWAESTIRRISRYNFPVSLITDNRFPSEVSTVLREPKGFVIRLTRYIHTDDIHDSEIALDNFNWDKNRCFVLDNSSMTEEQQNTSLIPIINSIINYK